MKWNRTACCMSFISLLLNHTKIIGSTMTTATFNRNCFYNSLQCVMNALFSIVEGLFLCSNLLVPVCILLRLFTREQNAPFIIPQIFNINFPVQHNTSLIAPLHSINFRPTIGVGFHYETLPPRPPHHPFFTLLV